MDIRNYAIQRLKEFQLCCDKQDTLQDPKKITENTNIILNILRKEVKLIGNSK